MQKTLSNQDAPYWLVKPDEYPGLAEKALAYIRVEGEGRFAQPVPVSVEMFDFIRRPIRQELANSQPVFAKPETYSARKARERVERRKANREKGQTDR